MMRALLSWGWRVDVLLTLCLLGGFYIRGWWFLRSKEHRLATGWRLLSYMVGLFVVGIALMSPVDSLGGQLFWMHMVQHLLLVMVAPPLLFLAEPFPFVIWGMPAFLRKQIIKLFSRRSSVRHLLTKASTPGLVWFIFVAFLWGWHDPAAYNAALIYDWVHDLEHLCFFGIGMLYWWQMVGAAPIFSKRLSHLARLIYAIAAVPPNMIVGVVLSFAQTPTYSYYLTVPRISDLTVMEDQHFGALIMWVPGSMMYMVAALIMLFRILQGESDKPPLPSQEWDTQEKMLAPDLPR